MSDSDLNKIKQIAEGHRTQPRPEAWERLNHKLNHKKAKVKMLTYRNISIAAILISVLSVTTVFSLYMKQHNPDVFTTNENFRPIIMEELGANLENPMFTTKTIASLNEAYLQGTKAF